MRWLIPLLLLGCAATQAPEQVPPPEAPELRCNPLDRVAGVLGKDYGERLAGFGLSGDGTLVMLFKSAKGTWTMVKVTPQDCAVMTDAGEAWESTTEETEEKPSF